MFDTSVDAAAPKFGIDSLKKEQVSAIRVTLCGNSVFVSLPTGFGKSLNYLRPATACLCRSARVPET